MKKPRVFDRLDQRYDDGRRQVDDDVDLPVREVDKPAGEWAEAFVFVEELGQPRVRCPDVGTCEKRIGGTRRSKHDEKKHERKPLLSIAMHCRPLPHFSRIVMTKPCSMPPCHVVPTIRYFDFSSVSPSRMRYPTNRCGAPPASNPATVNSKNQSRRTVVLSA